MWPVNHGDSAQTAKAVAEAAKNESSDERSIANYPSARLPKILTVDRHNGSDGRIKVVKQTRVHTDAARGFVPTAIRLKNRAVAEGAAPTCGAEMVRHQFGLPAINRIASAITCEVKLRWFVIRMQRAAF